MISVARSPCHLFTLSPLQFGSFVVLLAPDNLYLNTARQICAERHVRAWLVGGAVRDLLLGLPVGDWDIAVERDAIGIGLQFVPVLPPPFVTVHALLFVGD